MRHLDVSYRYFTHKKFILVGLKSTSTSSKIVQNEKIDQSEKIEQSADVKYEETEVPSQDIMYKENSEDGKNNHVSELTKVASSLGISSVIYKEDDDVHYKYKEDDVNYETSLSLNLDLKLDENNVDEYGSAENLDSNTGKQKFLPTLNGWLLNRFHSDMTSVGKLCKLWMLIIISAVVTSVMFALYVLIQDEDNRLLQPMSAQNILSTVRFIPQWNYDEIYTAAKIHIVTWNIGGLHKTKNVEEPIKTFKEILATCKDQDVVVIHVQETQELNLKLLQCHPVYENLYNSLADHLTKSTFKLVAGESCGTVASYLVVKSSILKHIQEVYTKQIPLSKIPLPTNRIAPKGASLIVIKLYGKWMCFCNLHLPAHSGQQRFENRLIALDHILTEANDRANYTHHLINGNNIKDEIYHPYPMFSTFDETFDYTIIAGDFNWRGIKSYENITHDQPDKLQDKFLEELWLEDEWRLIKNLDIDDIKFENIKEEVLEVRDKLKEAHYWKGEGIEKLTSNQMTKKNINISNGTPI